jgi:hypothetical protein
MPLESETRFVVSTRTPYLEDGRRCRARILSFLPKWLISNNKFGQRYLLYGKPSAAQDFVLDGD